MAVRKTTKEKWLKDLRSPLEEVVTDTIDSIAQNGDLSMVRPLLNAHLQHESEALRNKIVATLADVKADGFGDELFEVLEDEDLAPVRRAILSVMWNAHIPITGHLEKLIRVSMEGSFEEQFEVLTILENNTSELNEEEVMNSLLDMRDHMQIHGQDSEVLQEILQKLQILERFD